jgi:hypothetical protein
MQNATGCSRATIAKTAKRTKQAPCMRGERQAIVFAAMRAAMAKMRSATF